MSAVMQFPSEALLLRSDDHGVATLTLNRPSQFNSLSDGLIDELSAALSAADEATLTKTVMAPWQMESTVFMLATIAVNHIWYHDGQLNLIQALNGDGDVHWMG